MRKKRTFLPETYVVLMLLLMYLPIFVVVAYSFNDTKLFHWAGFTFSWYQKLFHNQTIINAFFNSLKLAVLSSGLAAILGTMGAVGMAGRTFFGKGVLEGLSTVPIMIPEIILGMVFLSVFSLMGLPFGMVTLVIAHTTFCVPYVFTMVRARLVGMDRSLEEAALDLGATKWQVFRDVILPQILPAILSGVLLAFAMSFDDVVISIFVTGPKVNTLPVKIYTKLKTGVTPEINALATVMLFVILLCLAGAYVLGRKSQTAVEKAAGGK